MRDYARITPFFWIGETGRALRVMGSDVTLVALYLLSCPSSNMIGLYYIPISTISHETGVPIEAPSEGLASPLRGVSNALRILAEIGFALYDKETSIVFVKKMAEYQSFDGTKPKDKRLAGARYQAEAYRNSPFYNEFRSLYPVVFGTEKQEPLRSPFEAPSMNHRLKEQEQEQEQKTKDPLSASEKPAPVRRKAQTKAKTKASAKKTNVLIRPEPKISLAAIPPPQPHGSGKHDRADYVHSVEVVTPLQAKPQELVDEMPPEGLHAIAYAAGLLENIGVPSSNSTLAIVAQAISITAKKLAMTEAAAERFLEQRARLAIAAGETVNRFWWEDAKFNLPAGGGNVAASLGMHVAPKVESKGDSLPEGAFDRIDDAEVIWKSLVDELREQMNRQSFETWIKPCRAAGLIGSELYVWAPAEEFKYLSDKYRDQFSEFLPAAVKRVEFLTRGE